MGKGVVTPKNKPKVMAIGRTTIITPTIIQIQIQKALIIDQAGPGDKAVLVNRTRAKINSKRAKVQTPTTIRRQVKTKIVHNNPRNATTTVILTVTVLVVVRFARQISNHRFRRSSISKVRPAKFIVSPAFLCMPCSRA
jgi:hypothetical protein